MSDLTPEEREALTCDCPYKDARDPCPAHGGDDSLWIDVPASEVVDRVERIVAAHVARATADAEARLAAVRAVMDRPNVVPVQTLEGVENAPVIWPLDLRAALDSAPTTGAACSAIERLADRVDERARQLRDAPTTDAAHVARATGDAEARLAAVRELHGRYFDLGLEPGDEDSTPEPEDVWRYDRDLRAALDDPAPTTDAD